ncbi:CD225/dispanin family protein [Nocardiopsis alba]|uniref:CD225/dispanin family protein n=1 Tax=Nocardiopsis TaxID=2013 RepID=UPI002DB75094|nr:CD225/dispanin family protein [Nocardiopsis sp. LDBS1602]MEC3892129.1 CD225/dispanin family protein [Nocardiopsis sp. LDBS1602]
MSYGPPPPGNPGPPPGGYGTGGYGPPAGGYGPPTGGQPGFGGQPPAEPPKTYLWMNILGIFGCTIIGIIGIIFALQVNSKWAVGDYAGAESASNTSKILGIISLIGFGLALAYILFMVVMMIVAVGTAPSYTY